MTDAVANLPDDVTERAGMVRYPDLSDKQRFPHQVTIIIPKALHPNRWVQVPSPWRPSGAITRPRVRATHCLERERQQRRAPPSSSAPFIPHTRQRFLAAAHSVIWPSIGDRIERIDHRDNANLVSDLRGGQLVGVPGTIEAFVMLPHDRENRGRQVKTAKNLVADRGMLLQALPFPGQQGAISIGTASLPTSCSRAPISIALT